jgi:hypothetical protein
MTTHTAPDLRHSKPGICLTPICALLACLTFANSAIAEAVIPLDSFVHFLQDTDIRVNKQLKREFARDIEHLDRLRTPMKLGDDIDLTVIRGGRTDSISGRFNGIINNKYVKVSSTHILLTDVEEQQRELLQWSQKEADDPDQAALDLETKREELKAKMLRRKHFLVSTVYSARGFQSPEHVRRNFLVVGDKLCTRDYLDSAGNLSLTVRRTKGLTTVDCQVRGAIGMKIALIISGQAVAAFDLEDDDKGAAVFRVMAEDVDGPLATMIGDYFVLVCHRSGIGTWPMAVRPGAKPSSLRTDGAVVEQIRFVFDLGETTTHRLKLPQVVEFPSAFTTLTAQAHQYQERLAKLTAPPPSPEPTPAPEVTPNQAVTPSDDSATIAAEPPAPATPPVSEEPEETGGGFGELPVPSNPNP